MKKPTMLFETLLTELAGQLGLSAARDVEVIQHRVQHEGLSFLTLTLPAFCDAFERGIEEGRLTRDSWNGSFRLPSRGCLPRFLSGFTKRVFEVDGLLLQEPCIDSIYAIRQITRFFKKLKIECTEDKNLAATQAFLAVEGELKAMTGMFQQTDKELDSVSQILWSQVFPEIDPTEIICQHGPGATAERKTANSRFQISEWYDRSEQSFPSDLHCIHNYGSFESLQRIDYLGVNEERPVRVVFVPKTLKAPRVIAIEPSHVQYMQQGLMRHVYPILERHPLTRKSIHFTDQQVNIDAARRASIDRSYSTIDLKDASDRVHFELVSRIFKSSSILPYLEDCRSLSAVLPNGQDVVLSKFASMGSAMCFPVEAMVFYTLIQSAVHRKLGIRPSSSSIRTISQYVKVYGDDIIVPVAWTDCVMANLEAYGLKVNRSKSFSKSHFRESCGGDYYKGVSVKPVYARMVPYDDMTAWTPNHFMSLASTADQFYELGLWKTCQLIRDWIESHLGPIPRSVAQREGLSFKSAMFTTDCKYNTSLQTFIQRRWVFSPVKRKDPMSTPEAFFLKVFGTVPGTTSVLPWMVDIVKDFESSAKRGAFKQKRRWIVAV